LTDSFILHLESGTQYERIENVVSFIGEDDSGSFGILPGHARIMTVLAFGLARFRVAGQEWEFLALPGALAYFVDNQLHLSTRRYLRDRDVENIRTVLNEELQAEEESLRAMKQSVSRLEEEMLMRLWKMRRGTEPS
jgi:F-type H+-transporting ATPase subunit epsilon